MGAEQGFRPAPFDDFAVAHDRDVIGQSGNDAQIVGDEQKRHPIIRAVADQAAKKIKDIGLRRHVERGRRLIRDQQTGSMRDGQRDADPLTLPTRQFVRIAVEGNGGEAHPVKPVTSDAQGLGPGGATQAQRLAHLRADGLNGVQCGHGFLKDHADVGAANTQPVAFAQMREVAPVQGDGPGRRRPGRQQSDHGERGHRLAGAALAHQPGDLSRRDRQVHVAQDRRAVDRQRQVGKLDHPRTRRRRGSSASRNPSPSRFSPRTMPTMARPGRIASCGSE